MRSEEKRRDICSSDGSQIQLPGELLALIRVLQHGGEEQQKPLRERASDVCEGQEEKKGCAELRFHDRRVTLPAHGAQAKRPCWWSSLTTRLTQSMTPAPAPCCLRLRSTRCITEDGPLWALNVGARCPCNYVKTLRAGQGRREG